MTKQIIWRFFIAGILIAPHTQAQSFEKKDYPQNYFRNPLGIPINLAANFGELRGNHFHMGLDIRTNQRENLPVYAAAEGYISRIKIEQYGFGRAIYITHPNGFTTLYAHLNKFYPALEKYIQQVQYEKEQWAQDFYLKPGAFEVSKGQFIANSGNTGGSAGPHLHFEIRETYTENNLNPLLFNLPVPDRIPPYLSGLYLYDRQFSTYSKPPVKIAIKKTGNVYTTLPATIVSASPDISLGIIAADKANASFKLGVYEAVFYLDDNLQSGFRLNNFSYPDSRYINASIDYTTDAKGGPGIQFLSKLPGNQSPVFLKNSTNGVISFTDNQVHTLKIIIKDAAGNSATLMSKIQYQPAKTNFTANANAVTLLPNQPNKVIYPNAEASFSARAFYDTVHFEHSSQNSAGKNSASPIEFLHNYTVPVHDSFIVRLKVNNNIPLDLRDRVVMQMISNRKKEALKGKWQNDWMEAKFRDLGSFQLLIDTISPTIQTVGWSSGSSLKGKSSMTILAKDDLSELAYFRAGLDGKWLMFSRKRDYFIHTFDERTPPGNHVLKVEVKDEAGNSTERTYTFSR